MKKSICKTLTESKSLKSIWTIPTKPSTLLILYSTAKKPMKITLQPISAKQKMINKILGKRKAIRNEMEEVKQKYPELYA